MKPRAAKSIFATVLAALSLAGCSDPQDVTLTRQNNACWDMECIYSRTEAPSHPLDLDEIICITLDRNLDLLVKEWEYAIQYESSTRETLKMLPGLIYNYENSGRNENTGSFSQSLEPGVPPAPPSISSEQHVERWDFSFVVNLLDFGLSYYRSRQEINRALMKCLEYERLRQNLVSEVVRSYWKAIAAKFAIDRATDVVNRATDQLGILQKEMDQRLITRIQGLRNQNQLLNIQIQLQAYDREYHLAMAELGQRMGLPPCIQFSLAPVTCFPDYVDLGDVCSLEQAALINRPELYSGDAEEMIWVNEVYAEILQMLPGIQLFSGAFHDRDKFLIHHNWENAGLRATWNLLSIPQHWYGEDIAVGRQSLTRANRMALSIGILTQVHLSYLVYGDNREQYLLARKLSEVNKNMLSAARDELKQGKLNDADILRYEAEALFSEINTLKAYADLMDVLEKLNNAMGLPRYFKAVSVTPIDSFIDVQLAPAAQEQPVQRQVDYYEPETQKIEQEAAPTGSEESSKQAPLLMPPSSKSSSVPTPSASSSKNPPPPDFSDVPRSFREDFPDMRKVDDPFDRRGPYTAPPPNFRSDNTQPSSSGKGQSVAFDPSKNTITTPSSSSDDDEQDRLERELEELLNS